MPERGPACLYWYRLGRRGLEPGIEAADPGYPHADLRGRYALGRTGIWTAAAVSAGLIAAGAASGDHPAPSFSQAAPLSTALNAGGDGAKWELVTTIPTGNPQTDIDYFTRGGDTYASVGTLAAGPNGGGQSIIRLTEKGLVDPSFVTGHPSADCPSGTSSATGLQHDVEATPKGPTVLNASNPFADTRDAQLLVDATDATGRCHDQGVFGAAQAPQGGLEVIDIAGDPSKPVEIGLTSHVGQAHTVNIDPKRPHIAYVSSSDNVAVDAEGKRANETSATSNLMDGIEVVDLSSCMNFLPGTSVDDRRKACSPTVYRYRWPEPNVTRGTVYNQVGACHELELYPDDRVACAGVTGTALFDFSGAFDDRGTPTDFTDDKPRGQPLPCARRPSSSPAPPLKTTAMVVDCTRTGDDPPKSLRVQSWLEMGAPSLEGVRWVGTVPHMGYAANQDHATAPYNATQDIIVAHESELTGSGRYILTTDERGGGVIPVGASCSPGVDNVRGNGGLHALPVGSFTTNPPRDPAEAQALAAKTSEGGRAVFRAPIRTEAQATNCTAHVMQQIPGQNRIFMAWYSQGTQVVDFTENADGTIDFKSAAWFIPENANQWVTQIFKVQQNADGTFTYWGATGDFALGDNGRNAIDIYKVTLPAPPKPRTADGKPPAGTPDYDTGTIAGVEAGASPACARTTSFDRVDIAPRGRRLGFRISRRGREGIRLDLFQITRGRTLVRRQVSDLATKRNSFSFRPKGRLTRGHYVVRLRTTTLAGLSDVRQFALSFNGKRFRRGPAFQEHISCQLIEEALLGRPVFGGRKNSALGVSFKLNSDSQVAVEVRRRGKVVKRFAAKSYRRGRIHRLSYRGRGSRGLYTVVIRATAAGKAHTTSLVARRL